MNKENVVVKEDVVRVPLLNIKMMTDEEWNRLEYKNYLERKGEIKSE